MNYTVSSFAHSVIVGLLRHSRPKSRKAPTCCCEWKIL